MNILADLADVANSEPRLPGWIWLATLAVALVSLLVAWGFGETTNHVYGRLREARWLLDRKDREIRRLRQELAAARPMFPPRRTPEATPPASGATLPLPVTGSFTDPGEAVVLTLPITEPVVADATLELEPVG